MPNAGSMAQQGFHSAWRNPNRSKSIFRSRPIRGSLTRETEAGDWNLANTNAGEELDSSKVTGVTSPFSSPTFTGVLPGAKLDESGTNKPTVVKIETFDDFNYTINVGAKTNDDYFVTLSVAAKPPVEPVMGKDEKPGRQS